jgi:hypothetical protein
LENGPEGIGLQDSRGLDSLLSILFLLSAVNELFSRRTLKISGAP